MTKYNGFEIITGTYIDNDAWFAIAQHPVYKTITIDHWDTERDAIEMIRNMIDIKLFGDKQ